jgi:hypothetical protein
MHPDVVKDAMAGRTMLQASAKWQSRFPEKILEDPAFEACPFDGPQAYTIPEEHLVHVTEMLDSIRLCLRFCDNGKDAGLVLEFRHNEDRVYALVGHSQHLERHAFQAEIFLLVPVYPEEGVSDERADDLPMLLRYLHAPEADSVHGATWPWINTETKFVMELAGQANDVWSMFQLTNETVGTCHRQVTERKAVNRDHLIQLDKERLQQAAAMKLFRKAAGLTQHTPGKKSGTARGRGRGGKGRGKAKDAGTSGAAASSTDAKGSAVRAKQKRVMSESSDSAEETETEEEDEPYVEKVLTEKALGLVKETTTGLEQKKKGPPPGYVAKANERVIEWWDGRFPFAKILSNGFLTGYGVVCGLHVNKTGVCANTPCKKSITIGTSGITEDEARKRLKRWIIQGHIETLDEESARQDHVHRGGVQLRDLASDNAGWADLDPDLDVLLECTCH